MQALAEMIDFLQVRSVFISEKKANEVLNAIRENLFTGV